MCPRPRTHFMKSVASKRSKRSTFLTSVNTDYDTGEVLAQFGTFHFGFGSSSRSASCCRRCGGGWGWTSRSTQTCLSAPGLHWWVEPTKSSRTSSTTRSPFLPMPSAGQTPTTPRCSCGGPGEERHWWSYRQNSKDKCLYTSAVSGSLCAEEGNRR